MNSSNMSFSESQKDFNSLKSITIDTILENNKENITPNYFHPNKQSLSFQNKTLSKTRIMVESQPTFSDGSIIDPNLRNGDRLITDHTNKTLLSAMQIACVGDVWQN